MTRYQISSRHTAHTYGIYEGETPELALAAMIRDAGGYDSETSPTIDDVSIEELQPEHLIGEDYTTELVEEVEFGDRWPLVTVHPDGTVGTIDEIVSAYDSDADRWVLIDVQDGRVVRAGTSHENDAAALRSELIDAGILSAEAE